MTLRTCAVALLLAAPAFAAAPKSAASSALPVQAPPPPAPPTGNVDLSLIDTLDAIGEPQLGGVFKYISDQYAPFAFAEILAADKKAMKRFLAKIDDDHKAAGGISQWEKTVCAVLVNTYQNTPDDDPLKPDKKRMSVINRCMLVPVVTFQEILMRRRR
jgi:hypothetical protein